MKDRNSYERTVLGSVLVTPSNLDLLAYDLFRNERHQTIYQGMQALRKKRTPVDLLTLTDQPKGEESASYLSPLMDGVERTLNIRPYLRELIGDNCKGFAKIDIQILAMLYSS